MLIQLVTLADKLFDKTIGMPEEGIDPICLPKIKETTHRHRVPTSLHGL